MGIIALVLPGCVNTKFKTDAPLQALAVADEPRAAQVGRDMLEHGGSAADAAAAMALAMTVTLPSRAGLGGGGVCVVFDAARKTTTTLDFRPRAGRPGGPALPGTLRAMYALNASLGKLRWEQVSVPAEVLARGNAGVSRAFANDAQAARLTDAEVLRLFQPGGRAPAEGSPLAQPELAAVLGRVRLGGLNGFYGGPTAEALATALGVDVNTVRTYQPRWGGTAKVAMGSYDLHFADLPGPAGGAAQAAAWTAGAEAPPAERVQRALRTLMSGTGGGSEAPAAGLAAIDGQENAVACALTMGGLFGAGRMVPGTGVLMAAPVERNGFGAPAVISNGIIGRAIFAGVGTAAGNDGPAAGPAGLLGIALPAIKEQIRPSEVMAARPATVPGRADIIACPLDAATELKLCMADADPRAHGVAHALDVPRND